MGVFVFSPVAVEVGVFVAVGVCDIVAEAVGVGVELAVDVGVPVGAKPYVTLTATQSREKSVMSLLAISAIRTWKLVLANSATVQACPQTSDVPPTR